MTDAEIFDTEMRPYGGRLQRERFPAEAKAIYAEIVERAENLIGSARRALPRLPHIHFDFVYDGAINAMAFRSNGRYFI